MEQQETKLERRKRREDEAVQAAKKMLDKLSADELRSAQEILSNDVKEIIAKETKDPGEKLGVKAVVDERQALESLKQQEYDKLVNKESLEKDFDKAEADYYDQLRGIGSQWATDMSIKAIKENGIFDENDKKEIYEMQLDMIATLNKEVDKLKEKIRVLTLENDRLKAGVG